MAGSYMAGLTPVRVREGPPKPVLVRGDDDVDTIEDQAITPDFGARPLRRLGEQIAV